MDASSGFVLVKFEDTQEIEVASTQWLSEGGTRCCWPNYKNQNRIVKAVSLHKPAEPNWTTHKIKLLGNGHIFEHYLAAVGKLGAVIEQSDVDVESDKERLGKRRKKKSVEKNVSESSDSDDTILKIKPLPPPPLLAPNVGKSAKSSKEPRIKSKPVLTSAPIMTTPSADFLPMLRDDSGSNLRLNLGNHVDPEGLPSAEIPDQIGAQAFPVHETDTIDPAGQTEVYTINVIHSSQPTPPDEVDANSNNSTNHNLIAGSDAFANWVVRNINILKAQSRVLQETLDSILLHLGEKESGTSSQTKKISHDIPMKNGDDVIKNKTFYENKENRDSLMKHLSIRGGKNVSKCTRRILSALCGDRLAQSYNWLGSRGDKLPFRDSWMNSIVLEAVRLSMPSKSITEDEIEAIIKEWLKASSKRLNDRKPKPSGDDEGEVHDLD